MMNWTSKEYKCTEQGCGRIFYTKWTLKRHSVIHSQIDYSTYKCEECDKNFSRKDSLDRHQQICHSSVIMMHMCSEVGCGKFFSLRSTLYRHMSSHKGTYDCEECGSSFTRKDNLVRHKITHATKLTKSRTTPKLLLSKKQRQSQCESFKVNTIETNDSNDGRGDHTYAIFAS